MGSDSYRKSSGGIISTRTLHRFKSQVLGREAITSSVRWTSWERVWIESHDFLSENEDLPVGGNRQILLRTLYLFPILCNKLISLKQYTSISVSVGLESRHNFSGSYAKRLTSLLTAFKVSSRTVVSSKAYRNLYAGQEATVRTGHGKTD